MNIATSTESPAKPTESLHKRTKDRMRAETASIGIQLFLERGFDDVTVEDICALAGLSRRSFFRYFSAKEEIVMGVFADLADRGWRAFLHRPVDDALWPALRHSMDPMTEWATADPDRAVAMIRLIDASPSLRAAFLDRVDTWRKLLAGVVSKRLGLEATNDLYAAVVAAAAMGAFVSGARAWADRGGRDRLDELFDEAFAAVYPMPLT